MPSNRNKTQTQWSFLIVISSSSCRAGSMDIPDPLSPLLPIVHRLWQVLWTTSRILTECMFVLVVLPLLGHVWGSTGAHHLWARPCLSSMSGSSNLNSFCDRRQVAVQLVSCSRLHAAFLCNCRLASSPVVLLESM